MEIKAHDTITYPASVTIDGQVVKTYIKYRYYDTRNGEVVVLAINSLSSKYRGRTILYRTRDGNMKLSG